MSDKDTCVRPELHKSILAHLQQNPQLVPESWRQDLIPLVEATSTTTPASAWSTLSDTAIVVDLGLVEWLPFENAVVAWGASTESRPVRVERIGDDLFVDGRKVRLLRVGNLTAGKFITGYELREQLKNLPTLDPRLIESLVANKHLIPPSWMAEENGHPSWVFFFGRGYGLELKKGWCVRYIFRGTPPAPGGVQDGVDWLSSHVALEHVVPVLEEE